MAAFSLSEPATYIVITASTAIIWSLLTIAIRVFLRLKISGPFSWDDTTCVAATFFGVLYSSLTLALIKFGLGRRSEELPASATGWAELLAWVKSMVLTLGIASSDLPMCFLIARICSHQRKVRIAYSIAVATVNFAVAAIFSTAFECKPPRPWHVARPRHCLDLWALYASTTVIVTVLELANVVAAVILVRSLHMPLWPKVQVIALFALRLLIIVPNIARLHYTHVALFTTDWNYSRVPIQIINQITLHLSIILATVPCAKPWLQLFESGGLHMPFQAASSESPAHRRPCVDGKSTSTYLARIPGRTGHRRRTERWRNVLRPDRSNTVTSVAHDPQDAKSAARKRSYGSSEDSRHGITRTDSVTVAYDKARNSLHQKHSVHETQVGKWTLPEL